MRGARRLAGFLLLGIIAQAQTSPQERTFKEPVSAVQSALKKLPGGTSGALPVVDGFVDPGIAGLDKYQRPYYRCAISVFPVPGGGTRVRVIAKITAWHEDGAKSGYAVLASSGRLESDLLDRLQQALVATANGNASSVTAKETKPAKAAKSVDTPTIDAPTIQFPRHIEPEMPSAPGSAKTDTALQREASSLEEILRNQSHPTNLVAIKKDKTPVLQSPALDANVLFLTSAEDEFEVLEVNPDWVHVRISGLSRGWLRRSSVEFLDGFDVGPSTGSNPASSSTLVDPVASSAAPLTPAAPPSTAVPSTAKFSISSEETGGFPGDWGPLKGKSVRIVSVQAAGTGATTAEEKLRFAEETFRKDNAPSSAGLVVIFDTEDGGMIAATGPVIEQWKKGTVSEEAFWKHCYVDPPEMLGSR